MIPAISTTRVRVGQIDVLTATHHTDHAYRQMFTSSPFVLRRGERMTVTTEMVAQKDCVVTGLSAAQVVGNYLPEAPTEPQP